MNSFSLEGKLPVQYKAACFPRNNAQVICNRTNLYTGSAFTSFNEPIPSSGFLSPFTAHLETHKSVKITMISTLHLPVQSNDSCSEHNISSRIAQTNLDYIISVENEATRSTERSADTRREEEGIMVTWQDLWVTVPNGRNGRKPILQGLTGYAKPGQVLAIMGPSGCGKSILLNAIAGRLGSNAKQTGKVLINGHRQALAYGKLAFVTQEDALFPTLTAGEAVYYSAQLQFPDSMSMAEKKERADLTLKEMGLQDAIHTRIGGRDSKGLSGGQKRRLGICIEILTCPRLLFLDEPTSGLDSAASFYVMSRIASLNLKNGIQRTIIASIHQPSTEVFELFHNLFLLSSGKTVFFGPASSANEFFASNGFRCPPLYNPSDHFLRTINEDFGRDAEEGFGNGIPAEEVINILVKSYASSELSDEVRKKVAEISETDCGAVEKKRIHAAFPTQCLVLIRRSFLHKHRDASNYWLRLAVSVAVAGSLGTIFHDIGSSSYESIRARGSLLTFYVSVMTFITLIGGFPSLVEEMKVFGRERLNGHYGVTAFVIGNTFSAVPYVLLISGIPGGLAYYLCELHKGLEHYLYFTCMLFATIMSIESLMMVVGSIFPNFIFGTTVAGGILGVMNLVGGFYRLPNDLPKIIWRYPLYYVSLHKYALQGLFKNDFDGLTFTADQNGDTKNIISGEEVLTKTWQVEMSHSKWVELVMTLGMAILYQIMFLCVIKIKERVKPIVAHNNCANAKFMFNRVNRRNEH